VDVELKLRLSLGRGRVSEADDRLFELLRAVDEHGSLRGASQAADLSYRAAWGLLRHWTDELGRPPVAMRRGRGAALTELGRKLLWAEVYARKQSKSTLETLSERLREELESVLPGAEGGRLIVFASHSMAQDILRELAGRDAALALDFHNHGSLDSLRALKEGGCDLAGFHLPHGSLRRQLAPHYRPWLADDHRLIRVASRRQGFMLRRDIDPPVGRVGDLTRTGLRFVNRQAGSGTRVLLDTLLGNESVDPARIAGYVHEEFTHSAVAALLSSGAADVGFGVEAAAVQFDLAFVPLATETYYFAVAEHTVQDNAAVQALISVLAGADFRRRVAALPGYDPRFSGRWEAVPDLFSQQAG